MKYTLEDISNILEFMYSARWRIGKDEYRKTNYALKVFLKKAEEVGIENAYKYFENMDSDSDDYPF